MTIARKRYALALGAGAVALAIAGGTALAESPKRGDVLNFVVGSRIPTYDGHRESTFGMIHPIRPFYSLLIRVNPDNPQSTTDYQCDLCEGALPSPTNDGKTYTFAIRKDVKFHDGTPLTAHDIKATLDKIIFPPEGIISHRKPQYSMVESVEATGDYTVVINLKYPSGAFIPALAAPFNFVYAKKDLEREDPEGQDPLYGMKWHQTNVNGTGAFKFVQHQPGAFVEGARYDGYHHEGKPYLDGFKAIAAPKTAVRINAIRGDQAAIEFRGFAPKQRDDLVAALGDQITVQESDWNCQLLISINHKKAPFDDVRVRQALMHAVDRWSASESISKIAIVKTVAGIVFPSHGLAIDNDTLKTYVGFWPDIDAARAEAKRLLKPRRGPRTSPSISTTGRSTCRIGSSAPGSSGSGRRSGWTSPRPASPPASGTPSTGPAPTTSASTRTASRSSTRWRTSASTRAVRATRRTTATTRIPSSTACMTSSFAPAIRPSRRGSCGRTRSGSSTTRRATE